MTHKYNTACRQCLSLMQCARMPCYICGPWPLPPLAVVTWVDDLGQVEPHPPGTVMHEPPTPLWIWCDRWERLLEEEDLLLLERKKIFFDSKKKICVKRLGSRTNHKKTHK